MTRGFSYFSTTALALCLTTAAGHADVTPAQVWDDLENYMTSFGYTVTATETAEGDALRITDAAFSMAIPDSEGSFSFNMSEVTLTDLGDGSVGIEFPTSMPIRMNFTPEGEDPVSMVIDYTHDGLDMVVSGDPDTIVYTYSADSLGFVLSELNADDMVITRDMFRFDMTAGPVEGMSTVTTEGSTRNIAQTMAMGTLAYDVAFNDPESDDSGLFAGQMQGLSFEGSSTQPVDFTPEMLTNMMAAGFAGGGTFAHEGGETQFAFSESDETTSGRTSSESGSLAVAVSGESLRYEIGGTGIALNVAGGEVPLPVDVSMAEMALVINAPMAASDTPEDIALALTLGGFEMSDLLWNIFDPAKVLPRDPATVAFDLAGKVTPFVSLYDAEAMAQLEQNGGVPGELNALTLKSLTVEAAGVSLTGTGDFIFDNSDMQSFDGLPKPTGEVNLKLVGANALIDKLIQMGLVAEQDAMGARMMMGMFTVPGSGPDDLSSKLEINEQGHILANGQRIQ